MPVTPRLLRYAVRRLLSAIALVFLVSSGALLLAVDPADESRVIDACRGTGIACAPIGAVTERRAGMTLVEGGRARALPTFPQDEISKLFAGG